MMISQYWPAAVSAALIAVLLMAAAPKRWLIWVTALVAAFPIILYIVVIAWETATRPGTQNMISNALLGFSILSAIFIIPWAVACLVLFAVGLTVRRMLHGPEVARTEPVALEPARPPMVNKTPIVTKFSTKAVDGSRDAIEWRQAHIGFANDGLKIAGHDVWGQRWRDVSAARLHLSHPSYPLQMDTYTVYEIGDGAAAFKFAASEVSNGVWSFYVSTRYPTETLSFSADGSLRFEQRAGKIINGRPDAVSTWAVLIDAVTDRVLIDCAAWRASQITNNADGSLFLRLRHIDGETLLRILPTSRTFCDQGMNGPTLPLADLGATVERALLVAERHTEPSYRRISPDGSIRIELSAQEWGNSQWVYAPRVIDIASGKMVLDLWNTDWDVTINYPANRCLSLDFRRYYFSGDLTIELDLAQDLYHITREHGGGANLPSGPLNQAAEAMDESGKRTAKFAAHRPIYNVKPNQFAAWRAALLILLGTMALIALATFLSLKFSIDPPRIPLRAIPRP